MPLFTIKHIFWCLLLLIPVFMANGQTSYEKTLSQEDLAKLSYIKGESTNKENNYKQDDIEYYVELDHQISGHSIVTNCIFELDNKLLKLNQFAKSNFHSVEKHSVLVNRPSELIEKSAELKSQLVQKIENSGSLTQKSLEYSKLSDKMDKYKELIEYVVNDFNPVLELHAFLSDTVISFPFLKKNQDEIYLNGETEKLDAKNFIRLMHKSYYGMVMEKYDIEDELKSLIKAETDLMWDEANLLESSLINLHKVTELIKRHQKEIYNYQKSSSEYTIIVKEVMVLTQSILQLKALIPEKLTQETNIKLIQSKVEALENEKNKLMKDLPKAFSNNEAIVKDRSALRKAITQFKDIKKIADEFPYNVPFDQFLASYFQSDKSYTNIKTEDTLTYLITYNGNKQLITKSNIFRVLIKEINIITEKFSKLTSSLDGQQNNYQGEVKMRFKKIKSNIGLITEEIEYLHFFEIIENKNTEIQSGYFPDDRKKPVYKRIYEGGVSILLKKMLFDLEVLINHKEKTELAKKIISVQDVILGYLTKEKSEVKDFEKELKGPIKDNDIPKLKVLFGLN